MRRKPSRGTRTRKRSGNRSGKHGEAHQKCAGPLLGLTPGDGADPAENGPVRDGQSQRIPAQDGDRRLCAATGFAGAEGAGEPAAPVQQQSEPAHPPRP